MGTLLRILIIVGLVMLAYGLLVQARGPGAAGASGVLGRIRQLGRKARLVALIYIVVIVVSAVLRLTGWIG